jgi:glyoxylate reductase
MKKKILITNWIPGECASRYQKKLDIFYPTKDQQKFSYEDTLKIIHEYDGLYTIGSKADKQLIDAGTKLKVIANLGVGYDNIDWQYCTKKGIAVVNCPTQVSECTAEHTIALMLAILRNIPKYDREIRKGIWRNDIFGKSEEECFNKVLGIIGFGRIGKLVCKKAQGLGMKVQYYDIYRADSKIEEKYNVRYVPFEEIIGSSNVLSIHIPYVPDSHHLFNEAVFRKVRRGTYFINASRGPIVKESDLVKALQEGILKGAALDVFEFEPNVDSNLLSLENVVMTPHIASQTYQVRVNMFHESMKGVLGVLNGDIPNNVINKEVLE